MSLSKDQKPEAELAPPSQASDFLLGLGSASPPHVAVPTAQHFKVSRHALGPRQSAIRQSGGGPPARNIIARSLPPPRTIPLPLSLPRASHVPGGFGAALPAAVSACTKICIASCFAVSPFAA